jgi:FAD:protein FMN transferase
VADVPGIRRVEFIMGMPIVVDVRDDGAGEGLLDRVFDWFRTVDAVFSTYKDDSEISRLNRDELALRECSADVRAVIGRCRELAEETDGYFDAEAVVPGQIDPSGLVKGWSVDRAAELLDAAGARNYAVNAGGDIRLRGGALPDPRWRVGIQHPQLRDRIAAVVEGDDLAVATSGEYARGQHVVDPHTGGPPHGLLSVTITGPDLATADAYATAAFAMGADGPEWTRRLEAYEAMSITVDGRVLSTPGFPRARDGAAPDVTP